jgi:hypothetical protein
MKYVENDELAMTYVIWGFLGIKLYKSIDIEIYVTILLADALDFDLYELYFEISWGNLGSQTRNVSSYGKFA